MLFPRRYHEGQEGRARVLPRPSSLVRMPIGTPLSGLRRDGSEFPIEMSISPIETEDGLLYASAIRDNTERKELEKQIADLADQEQRRIGQDLHDSVGQQVTGIAMLAASIRKRLESIGAPDASEMNHLVESIHQTQAALRNVTRAMLPVELDANGLTRALRTLTQRNRDLYRTECVLEGDDEVSIRDSFTANHLYRIAQEAIHNALKHGRARRVVTSVRSSDGRIALEVRDDGVGIGGDVDTAGGMGIRIMRYRAGLIGATLDIDSVHEGGTIVRCTLEQAAPSFVDENSPPRTGKHRT
jgi:two-component system CheB/CheR fusion protein